MNILVISSPRSRSSFFCDHLSKFYNVQNFHEIYDYREKTEMLYSKAKMTDQNFLELLIKDQTAYLHKTTKETLEISSINKFFPRHIICNSSKINSDIDNIYNFSYKLVNNFIDVLQISKYDSIFVLQRNITDIVASYLFAIKTKKLLHIDSNLLEYISKKHKNVEFTVEDHSMANYLVFENLLLQSIKSVLQNSKIAYQELNFIDIPKFLEINYKIDQPNSYLESNLDYSKIFSNYKDLNEHCVNVEKLLAGHVKLI
jgi:hypothetical protein